MPNTPQRFMPDTEVVARILHHIENKTTDRGDEIWQEPVENYRSEGRLKQELEVFKSVPTPFCPSTALAKVGDYIARNAAGVPLIVTRGQDGNVRAFKNACRHRGAELASGKGCAGAFVCPYHGWSYGLDGALLGIAHEDGFPGFDTSANGLIELGVIEQNGLIFIVQNNSGKALSKARNMLAGLPRVLTDDQNIFSETEIIVEANWKLHLESFLEGYHIKPAHKNTFFPFGYDNLNIIEFCGPHSRVTFPFKRIETLKDTAMQNCDVPGKLTYVTHLFPNVILAELSHHLTLGILEPLGIGRTKITSYHMTKSSKGADKAASLEAAKRDIAFVNQTGQHEDIALVTSIQRGLNSKANDIFTFGHFEPAITHFHKTLSRQLAKR